MGLKVWLPLDGSLRQLGTKEYTIAAARGNIVYNDNGKIGKCFYSNGVNTLKITNIIPDIYNYSSYSLSAWFYIETNNTSHTGSSIISGGNWNQQLLNLAVSDWSTDHYTKLRISGSNWTRTYNYNFYKNTWYHAVVCDDGTHTYGYVNGTLIGDTAASFLPSSIEGNDIYIGGATYSTSMQFFGKINDVRIYDHCLSAAKIREISQGLVLHYKLDQSNPNLISSDTFINTPWATAIAAHEEYEGRLAYRLQCRTLYVNTSNGTVNIFPDITYQENTQYTLSITWRDDYRTDDKNSNLRITFNYTDGSATHRIQSPANTVSSWIHTKITSNAGKTLSKITASYGNSGYLYITDLKLEIGTLDTGMLYTDGRVQDSSGYGYNGTLNTSTTLTVNSARYSNAMYFGTNNAPKITTDNVSFLSTLSNCTISWWEYCTNSGDTLIFSGQNNYKFIAAGSTSTRLYDGDVGSAILYKDGVQETNHNTSQQSAYLRNQHNGVFHTQNEWHHFVLVNADLSTWTTFKINGYGSAWPVRGYISDVRIYATALSTDAIRQLYEVGAKVDNKQNLHAFELVENNSKIQITKRGQIKCNELEEDEKTKFYQTDQIIETNEIIEL